MTPEQRKIIEKEIAEGKVILLKDHVESKPLTKAKVREIQADIEKDGMWYCFSSYSDYEEVDDKEFHRLREAFIKAGEALEQFLAKKCKETR